jgi:peptidoglycan/LPS O-acetylase OafA/YrhL
MHYKLESLRGIAACLVVLFHSPFKFWDKNLLFISNSYLFVDFFFILSGFVMALAYSSRINEGLSFKEYSFLRLGRVYPLHFFVLIAWVPYILGKQYLFEAGYGGRSLLAENNIRTFLTNVFLLHSFSINDCSGWNYPSWSISAEFLTYIIFFCVTWSVDKKNSLFFPILISIGCYIFLISLNRGSLDITNDYGLIRCLGSFYVGVFLFRFSKLSKFHERVNQHLWIFEIVCLLSIVCLVSIAEKHTLLFIPVIAVFAGTIFVFSHKDSGVLGRLLESAALRKMGLWSYSIYMIHAIIINILINVFKDILGWDLGGALGVSAIVINSVSLLIIVSLSRISYSVIETPFRNASRNFIKRLHLKHENN